MSDQSSPSPQHGGELPHIKIAPSILSADFARLGEQIAEATQAGADYIHVDIMDGRFVPKITIGPQVVAAIRSWTPLPLDVHLMIVEPDRLIPEFVKAGSDIITIHAEACTHLHRVVHQIKDLGAKAGVALNPATPVVDIEDVLGDLDLVLAMTVNPGFPAQQFIPGVLRKIRRLRKLLNYRNLKTELEVDGGIKEYNAKDVVRAGARVLVAGSFIYNNDIGIRAAVEKLRSEVTTVVANSGQDPEWYGPSIGPT
jgi:ribulose-phosphate 3-epimerase